MTKGRGVLAHALFELRVIDAEGYQIRIFSMQMRPERYFETA